MKTEGNYKEMPIYSPFAYLHEQRGHFDVIVKTKLPDTCNTKKITSDYDPQTNNLVFTIPIKTNDNKNARGKKLLYLNKIELPVSSTVYNSIVIKVTYGNDGTNESPGGTTVIRYGEVDPSAKK